MMKDIISRKDYLFWTIGGCLTADLLSLIAFTYPIFGQVIFIVLIIALAVVVWRSPAWAIVIYLAELILGSKGYLFFYNLGGNLISIRIAWFIILFSFVIVNFFIYKWWTKINKKLLVIWGLQILAVVLGATIGFVKNDFGNWFLDVNGYIYLLIFWPIYFYWPEFKIKFSAVIFPVLGYLAAKSLVFVYLYSHFNVIDLDNLYHWFRDTGFGEITYASGSFFRIFSQSHIFVLLSSVAWFIYVLFLTKSEVHPWRYLLRNKPIILFFSLTQITVLLASLSRSFWLGAVASIVIFYATWIILVHGGWRTFVKAICISLFSLLLAVGLLYSVMQFPWPAPKAMGNNMLLERTSQGVGEAAGAARLQLLSPLWFNVNKNILWGSGFGATVTYLTTDPRIVKESVAGQSWYTTYAFEWGYLDMWLKFGLVGLLCYLALFVYIIRISWARFKALDYRVWLCYGCLLALLMTNITTPYLNHPLGIGIYSLISLYLFFYSNADPTTI